MPVGAIVFQKVREVVDISEVIDGNNRKLRPLERHFQKRPAYPPKPIDSYSCALHTSTRKNNTANESRPGSEPRSTTGVPHSPLIAIRASFIS